MFYDVIMIGSGPCSSALAALLSKKGMKILILEKNRHPNFHLPETFFLPPCIPLFKKIKIKVKDLRKTFLPKMSMSFIDNKGTQSIKLTHTYNKDKDNKFVRINRRDFDSLILNQAIYLGAEYIDNALVKSVDFSKRYPEIIYEKSSQEVKLSAKLIVDASGKEAFLAKHLNLKIVKKKLDNKICVFSHFEIKNYMRHFLKNNQYIIDIEVGHCFVIPIADDRFSIGFILHEATLQNKITLEEIFEEKLKTTPWLSNILKNSKRVLPYLEVFNYSHICKNPFEKKYFIVGDAAYFMDPFFSNGLSIGLQTILVLSDKMFELVSDNNHKTKEKLKNKLNVMWRSLIKKEKYFFKLLEKNCLTINCRAISDPHMPYGILFFLLSIFSSQNLRNDNYRTLAKLRNIFDEKE